MTWCGCNRGDDLAVRSALRTAFGAAAGGTGAGGGAGRLMNQTGTYQTRISDYGGVNRSAGDAALAACAALYGRCSGNCLPKLGPVAQRRR